VTVNDPATSVPKPTASSEGSETAMAGVFVFVFGLLAALYSQYSALTNEYVIHNDVRQWLYYVQQWANPELFQDDLLTELTKALQPWGMTLVYRAASLFVDPLYFSKLLPVILLPIAAWYFFRLVELRAGLFAGLLGGVIFIVVPAFLHGMVGGLSRSFGFPLLLAFLFYQSKEDYPKSALVLVLQALVHPMTSVVCVASYGLSFLHVRRPYVALPPLKSGCYAAACLAVGLILGLKYLSPPNPSLGSVTMRAAMVGKPEFYKGAGIRGRTKVLPVEPMYQMAVKSTLDPLIGRAMVQRYRRGVGPVSSFLKESHKIALYLIFIAAPFYLVWEARKKKIRIPWPIVHIVLASLVLYQLANLVFFKLYAPSRYLVFSMPVVGVFLFSTVLATWVGRLPAGRVRRFVQVTLLVILMIQVPLHKDMLLTDESDRKDLFVFLSSLPSDSLVAAHPESADSIPLLSGRTVFVNYELSIPYVDAYWQTIQRRTRDLFSAYYSANPSEIAAFSEESGIDYLVVERRHFSEEYFEKGRIYFDPFNDEIFQQIEGRRDFALLDVPTESIVFEKDGIFVVSTDALAPEHGGDADARK
jgi:hypothetical protein